MTPSLRNSAQHISDSIRIATTGLIGRNQLAELIILAAVAQEHLLVVGPPGTAKSAVVRRVAQALGGKYFEYLLGRFTEPSELFGPVDLKKLREGLVETDVTGMLPEADIVFLDEVFLGSTAILNTLLGVLNERRFRRGHTQISCPLKICVGAANGLPTDEGLAAFADRFLVHLFVSPVADHQLEAMLAGGWFVEKQPPIASATLQHLDTLSHEMKQVDLDAARPALVNAIRTLRSAGIQISDRRIVKSQKLIAAATVLAGRMAATDADIWPLLYVLPTQELQNNAREILRDQIASATNPTLFSAVEEAVQQPLSRVGRLLEAGTILLSAETSQPEQIEAILREIDANFTEKNLPHELAQLRTQLMTCHTSLSG